MRDSANQSLTALLTLLPTLPPTSARKQMILPFAPFFSLISLLTSSTLIFPFLHSRSSSFPHSIPFCTRAQCARCRLSSSGAAFVYVSEQMAQVRKTEVSKAKCSCVSCLCLPFAFSDSLLPFFGFVFALGLTLREEVKNVAADGLEKASRMLNVLLGGTSLTERSSRRDRFRLRAGDDRRSPPSSSSSSSRAAAGGGDDDKADGGEDEGKDGVGRGGREPYVRFTRADMVAKGRVGSNAPNTGRSTTRRARDPVDFVALLIAEMPRISTTKFQRSSKEIAQGFSRS